MTLTCDTCGELYDAGDRPAKREVGHGRREGFSCWPCFSNSIDRTPMGDPLLRRLLGLPAHATDESVRDAIKAQRLAYLRRQVRPA